MVNEEQQQLELIRDFVNTLDIETGVDTISTPDDLAAWLSDNALTDDFVEASDEEHADAVRVREALRELLLAHNAGEVDAEAAARTLDEVAQKARLGLRFQVDSPVLQPDADGARAALGRILATVAELMPTDEWKRLKACRDETCRVAFYDQSRNRSRAWCSMQVCGNREKARTFRERHGH